MPMVLFVFSLRTPRRRANKEKKKAGHALTHAYRASFPQLFVFLSVASRVASLAFPFIFHLLRKRRPRDQGQGASSSSSYYSPHRCKFNSKRQSSTLNSIQKDKKGPRFPRQITPTRKWTHSSCISSSRESLLHTPVHPRIPAALIAAVGRVPRRWCIFYSKSTGVSHNSHMWDSRYGPP